MKNMIKVIKIINRIGWVGWCVVGWSGGQGADTVLGGGGGVSEAEDGGVRTRWRVVGGAGRGVGN